MENSFEIRLTKAINFKNHKQLCRLCLSKFKNDRDKVKITKIIEDQYFMLTIFNLNSSTQYSQFICSQCRKFLSEYTIQRNDWIFKQSQLEKFVDNDGGTACSLKQESFDNPHEDSIIKIESDDDDTNFCNNISSDEFQADLELPEPSTSTPNATTASSELLTSSPKSHERQKSKSSNIPLTVEDASSDDDDYEPKSPDSASSYENFSHSKKARRDQNHYCKICKASYRRKEMLDLHLLNKHKEELTEDQIDDIKMRREEIQKAICSLCGKGMHASSLRRHISRCHTLLSPEERTKILQQGTNACSVEQSNFTRWQREKLLRIHHCHHCNSSFQHLHMLNTHRLKAHPATVSDEEAKMIVKRNREGGMKVCQDCGIVLPGTKMASHLVNHRAKDYSCDNCDYKTQKRNHMRVHVLKHIKVYQKEFTCHICSKNYLRENGLKTHMRQCHQVGKIYKCENVDCGEEFTVYWKYHKHKKYDCGDSTVQCIHCTKEVSKKGIAGHLKVDFEDRLMTFVCTECDQIFPNRKCLNHHQMLHKEKIYYCDFKRCTKCFISRSALDRHLETHQGIKNHHCPNDGCDKSFVKAQSLRIHILIKHENYRKKCPVKLCTFEAGIAQQMKLHIVSHSELSETDREQLLAQARNMKLY